MVTPGAGSRASAAEGENRKGGLLSGKFSIMPQLPDSVRIEHGGTIEYVADSQMITYVGSPLVKVRTDTGTEIFAHKVRVDLKTSEVLATGDVTVFQGDSLTRGEAAVYNWKTREVEIAALRTKVDALLLESGKFASGVNPNGQRYFRGTDAGVTTEDIDRPTTWLRSKQTTVWPGDRVEFKNLKVYAGDVPIFYLPSFSRSLNPEVGWYPRPGARTEWGGYLLNSYGFILGEKEVKGGMPTGPYIGTVNFDLRSRRGVGGGLDIRDTDFDRRSEFTGLKTYFAYDTNPNVLILGDPRSDVPDNNRWRWQLRERFLPGNQDGETRWRVDVDMTGLSDRYVQEDFFSDDYSSDPKPDNEIHAVRTTDTSVLTGMMRFDPNGYYQTNSRLPEITYDRVRGPVFGRQVIYEGTTSFAVLRNDVPGWERERFDDIIDSLPANDPSRQYYEGLRNTDRFSRFHTYHELAVPRKLGNFLNIAPKVGGGYTGYYGIEGEDASYNRGLFYTGVNADTKLTRVYEGAKSRALGLDGLLHVVEPYTQYSFVHTNELDPLIPSVDGYTASTRPNALSVGRFTAIDDLASWSIQRFGVRNTLMTRRDGISVPWLAVDTYIEAFYNDPEFSRNYSNLYNDIRWNPNRWTRLTLETQFPVTSGDTAFTEVSTRLSFMPVKELEIELGHRYLNGHPILDNTNLVNFGAMVRLNQGWAIGARYRWELDDSSLQLQEYTLWRDVGGWALGLGLYERNNRSNDKSDYGVMISLVLKEFPDIRMPMKIN